VKGRLTWSRRRAASRMARIDILDKERVMRSSLRSVVDAIGDVVGISNQLEVGVQVCGRNQVTDLRERLCLHR
jgi:hypothetical protein